MDRQVAAVVEAHLVDSGAGPGDVEGAVVREIPGLGGLVVDRAQGDLAVVLEVEHVGVAGRRSGALHPNLNLLAIAQHVQRAFGGRRSHADVAAPDDHDRAVRGAGTDSKRQGRATACIPNEEVRLVAGHIPGVRSEPAGAVLLEAESRRVTALDVQFRDRGRGSQTNSAAVVDEERVAGRPRLDGEWRAAARGVVDRKFIGAAVGRIVRRQLPIVPGIGTRGRGGRRT